MGDNEMDPLVDDEIIAISVEEIYAAIKSINAELPALEAGCLNEQLINKIFRYFHSLKGLAGMLKLERMRLLCQRVEDVLDTMRAGAEWITHERIDLVFEGTDICKLVIDARARTTADPATEKRLEALFAAIDAAAKKPEEKQAAKPAHKEPPPAPADAAAAQVMDHTIRIRTEKLDFMMNRASDIIVNSVQLLGSVNEIRLLSAKVKEIGKGLETMKNKKAAVLKETIDGITAAFGQSFSNLDKIVNVISESSAQLTDGIVKSRMVNIEELFSLFPRLVRDVARQFGKHVKLVVSPESQIEIDKQLVEMIYTPLVHILRNSVDHGIEEPLVRKEKGKPETGTITINAEKDEMFLHLEIRDDGQGIDPAGVAAAALRKGLVTPEKVEKMKDSMKIMLICLPGFSTKETATDISGRGVGMDVVLSNVEKMNGSLEIESEIGKGTTFKLMLPHNVAFIQGFLYQDSQ